MLGHKKTYFFLRKGIAAESLYISIWIRSLYISIWIRDSAYKYKWSLTTYTSDHICITNYNKEGGF